jgi:hypothetical protein
MYVKAQNVLGTRKPKGLNRIANFRRADLDLAIFHRWIRSFLVSSKLLSSYRTTRISLNREIHTPYTDAT